jgi:hypothetical protein
VRILESPRCRWSLPLIGEEEDDEYGGGALGAPLSGCSTLGAKLERIDEECNDLSGIILLLLGSNLSLIF